MKIYDGKIPFHPKTGEMQYYAEWVWMERNDGTGGWHSAEPEWRDNVAFDDTLTFSGFSRGRSAANLSFKTSDGKEVTVFLVDFVEIAPHMIRGVVRGKFAYCKRGQNFGIKLVETADLVADHRGQHQIHAGTRR